MTTNSQDKPNTSTPTTKTVSLTTPAPRSDIAKSFLEQKDEPTRDPENLEKRTIKATVNDSVADIDALTALAKKTGRPKHKKLTSSDRKYKAAVRYMQQQGIEDDEAIEYTRLNCDIPSDLHNWLNMYSRSGGEFSSMTEIAIEVLGNFAKEHGFTLNK